MIKATFSPSEIKSMNPQIDGRLILILCPDGSQRRLDIYKLVKHGNLEFIKHLNELKYLDENIVHEISKIAAINNHLDVLKYLSDNFTLNNKIMMCIAAEHNNINILKFFHGLNYLYKLTDRYYDFDESDDIPFGYESGEDEDDLIYRYETAYDEAIRKGYSEIINYFVEHGYVN